MPENNKKKNSRPELTQIQLSGSGGQGLILAGIILAAAAVADGYYVIQSQSYGPEARGGASVAEVIMGTGPIDYPHVERADILLALTQEACVKYLPEVSSKALVIVDSLLVDKIPANGATVVKLPIVQTARTEIGREMVANIVALGALNSAAGLVSWPALEEAVLERVPTQFSELNKRALEAGRALASRKNKKE
ncbi:MAG: 2-oxoacid:acceptor oxidoreductase family protein [Desulfocucumaceae bacterium]